MKIAVRGAVALAAILAACRAPGDRPGVAASVPAACPHRTLGILEFNIEYGGTLVSFAGVAETIRRSGADVVAVEEGYGNVDSLARELGWRDTDRRTQVISRLPLVGLKPGDATYVTAVEASPGCVVYIANVHLPSDSSGEELRARGGSQAEVVALEQRRRMPALEQVLRDLGPLLVARAPVILAGDFNAPSHRDDSLPWPTSLAVEAAGFHDSYREAHPDPRARPGFTWWAGRSRVAGWNPGPTDQQSRIDFLYASGPVRVRASRLLGERGARDVDMAIEPWVSDHRALLSSFEVEPAPAPALVAVRHQRVVTGEAASVQYHAPTDGASIRFVLPGETPQNARMAQPAPVSREIRMMRIPTEGMSPGAWEVLLVNAGGAVLTRAPFWVTALGGTPAVAASTGRYRSGEAITVRWQDAPGDRWDWVGVYPPGAKPETENPLLWRHIGSRVAGQLVLDRSAEGGGWPLAPGPYRLVLALDDSYVVLAETRFEVAP